MRINTPFTMIAVIATALITAITACSNDENNELAVNTDDYNQFYTFCCTSLCKHWCNRLNNFHCISQNMMLYNRSHTNWNNLNSQNHV